MDRGEVCKKKRRLPLFFPKRSFYTLFFAKKVLLLNTRTADVKV